MNYIIFSPEIDWQKNCIDCFQKAYALFTQEPPAFLFTIREQLSYICYYITENCQSEINAPSSYNFIEYQRTKQLLEYIHTQYNQPISLKSLALFANISERECFRCFQKILHTSHVELRYSILKSLTDVPSQNSLPDRGCSFSGTAKMNFR